MAKALSTIRLPTGYKSFLQELKQQIQTAQVRAALSVNQELIRLYWHIGQQIVLKQEREKWGMAVLERLAKDLQKEFPEQAGFSRTNIFRMRALYLAYRNAGVTLQLPARTLRNKNMPQIEPKTVKSRIVPPAVGQLEDGFLPEPLSKIPWSHNVVLMEKIKNSGERIWYAYKTIEHGWTRNLLAHQIESGLYHRQGKAITNFSRTLPDPQSDLTQQLLKDPYNFDFLTIGDDARERDVERGLLEQLRSFLLELGVGFAFVGQQVHLEVGGEDFYIDLLFYHLILHRYVVIDLKTGAFKPEDTGKMNFYLSAVDSKMRYHDDRPSIGLILCKTKNKTVAEYALRDMAKPVGLSSYVTKFTASLPPKLKGKLPTIAELEAELQ